MIAVEELNIRTNIAARTSPLLLSGFLPCKIKVAKLELINYFKRLIIK
jgi:hypothetical protein